MVEDRLSVMFADPLPSHTPTLLFLTRGCEAITESQWRLLHFSIHMSTRSCLHIVCSIQCPTSPESILHSGSWVSAIPFNTNSSTHVRPHDALYFASLTKTPTMRISFSLIGALAPHALGQTMFDNWRPPGPSDGKSYHIMTSYKSFS